jgi:hypothetical protein
MIKYCYYARRRQQQQQQQQQKPRKTPIMTMAPAPCKKLVILYGIGESAAGNRNNW